MEMQGTCRLRDRQDSASCWCLTLLNVRATALQCGRHASCFIGWLVFARAWTWTWTWAHHAMPIECFSMSDTDAEERYSLPMEHDPLRHAHDAILSLVQG